MFDRGDHGGHVPRPVFSNKCKQVLRSSDGSGQAVDARGDLPLCLSERVGSLSFEPEHQGEARPLTSLASKRLTVMPRFSRRLCPFSKEGGCPEIQRRWWPPRTDRGWSKEGLDLSNLALILFTRPEGISVVLEDREAQLARSKHGISCLPGCCEASTWTLWLFPRGMVPFQMFPSRQRGRCPGWVTGSALVQRTGRAFAPAP